MDSDDSCKVKHTTTVVLHNATQPEPGLLQSTSSSEQRQSLHMRRFQNKTAPRARASPLSQCWGHGGALCFNCGILTPPRLTHTHKHFVILHSVQKINSRRLLFNLNSTHFLCRYVQFWLTCRSSPPPPPSHRQWMKPVWGTDKPRTSSGSRALSRHIRRLKAITETEQRPTLNPGSPSHWLHFYLPILV